MPYVNRSQSDGKFCRPQKRLGIVMSLRFAVRTECPLWANSGHCLAWHLSHFKAKGEHQLAARGMRGAQQLAVPIGSFLARLRAI